MLLELFWRSLSCGASLCTLSCSVSFLDMFFDWKQNANEVIVKLRSGDGIARVEDVSADFSDTACQINFPGNPALSYSNWFSVYTLMSKTVGYSHALYVSL